MNSLDIIVPNVTLTSQDSLTWTDIVGDTVKATKSYCDPVSECTGAILGCLCCIATTLLQVKEDKKRPATRFDVVNQKSIRARQRAEREGGYECGYCLGDILVDSGAIILGGAVGTVRATVNTIKKETNRSDTVLGLTREEIDQVDLFDSCECCTSCYKGCCGQEDALLHPPKTEMNGLNKTSV